jgi:hypothetical protein
MKPKPKPTSAKRIKKTQDAPDPSLKFWRVACAAILIGSGLLRLLYLTEKPLHHDEGVNGLFMASLFRRGFYHYDPANYHGPTLYYFGWLTTTLNSVLYGKYGLSTLAIRLVPALFGIGIVWLMFYFRRFIGTVGALAAALLAAASPGFVFFSRYFIHEILFVFFTLALVAAVMRFRETAAALPDAGLGLCGFTIRHQGNLHYYCDGPLAGPSLCSVLYEVSEETCAGLSRNGVSCAQSGRFGTEAERGRTRKDKKPAVDCRWGALCGPVHSFLFLLLYEFSQGSRRFRSHLRILGQNRHDAISESLVHLPELAYQGRITLSDIGSAGNRGRSLSGPLAFCSFLRILGPGHHGCLFVAALQDTLAGHEPLAADHNHGRLFSGTVV